MSLLTGSVPLSRHYHPIVQLSEDNLEWSLSSGAPVIMGGWTVQEVELLLSWGLQETDIAQATFSAARAAFCNDQDKKELMKELRKVFGIEDKVELEVNKDEKIFQSQIICFRFSLITSAASRTTHARFSRLPSNSLTLAIGSIYQNILISN